MLFEIFSDFNQQEFENWKENCARYKVVMPAVEFIRQKNKNIQSALGYKGIDYSVEELVDTNYGIKKAQFIKVCFRFLIDFSVPS